MWVGVGYGTHPPVCLASRPCLPWASAAPLLRQDPQRLREEGQIDGVLLLRENLQGGTSSGSRRRAEEEAKKTLCKPPSWLVPLHCCCYRCNLLRGHRRIQPEASGRSQIRQGAEALLPPFLPDAVENRVRLVEALLGRVPAGGHGRTRADTWAGLVAPRRERVRARLRRAGGGGRAGPPPAAAVSGPRGDKVGSRAGGAPHGLVVTTQRMPAALAASSPAAEWVAWAGGAARQSLGARASAAAAGTPALRCAARADAAVLDHDAARRVDVELLPDTVGYGGDTVGYGGDTVGILRGWCKEKRSARRRWSAGA